MSFFDELKFGNWISELQHLLPAQAPLKDFVHHNTLHGFQHLSFFEGLKRATIELGYESIMPVEWYKKKYLNQEIDEKVLVSIISKDALLIDNGIKSVDQFFEYESPAIHHKSSLRGLWKRYNQIDLDANVHPLLFRITSNYLDQGISELNLASTSNGFLLDLISTQELSLVSLFKSKNTQKLLINWGDKSTSEWIWFLLDQIIGNSELFKDYLFEQQLLHPGWSGMVNQINLNPKSLIQPRKIDLLEFIALELLLEYDTIQFLKKDFLKIGQIIEANSELKNHDFSYEFSVNELDFHIRSIWQSALEWSYYSHVITALDHGNVYPSREKSKEIQALFCIDDREESIRRHLEQTNSNVQTFGTPGFFGLEFYFQPTNAVALTKSCPAPVNPNFVIQELGGKMRSSSDIHFSKKTHSMVVGWLITHSVAFWAVFRLIWQIFYPTKSRYSADSHEHMDAKSELSVFHKGEHFQGLQVGFTKMEAALRLEGLLKSIGLGSDFGKNVYLVSHGASSVNNPHYAAYDCGACCGRPGSVNARAMAIIANDSEVREILYGRGIVIPENTCFIGALHDTTRDEILFYDEPEKNSENGKLHLEFKNQITNALMVNAVERSKNFKLIDPLISKKKIALKVKNRSISLFEPRPELNHATNSLCIIGPRTFSKNIFLNRRAFLNSYCPEDDANGDLLYGIIKAAAPVCGGINLEYFFSRVDNHHLGAGSKLPHNVMGLIGVANGADGDLRPGLPSQMIEIHDPIRLLMVVNQNPEIVLEVIQRDVATCEWFKNQWINLMVCDPISKKWYNLQLSDNLSQEKPKLIFVDVVESPLMSKIPASFSNHYMFDFKGFSLPEVAILN